MSADIQVYDGAKLVAAQLANLAASSALCSTTSTGRSCTVFVGLARGNYNATITLYDGTQTTSKELGQASDVQFAVSAGSNTSVDFSVDGVPHALKVSAASPRFVRGTQSSGYVIYGNSGESFKVTALDVDGNIIVGDGAPGFNEQVTWSGATTTTTNGQTFEVRPPNINGDTATVTITAVFGNATICTVTNAQCSVSFSLKNETQTLFIGDAGKGIVQSMLYPYTLSSEHVVVDATAQTSPYTIAVDSLGDLFADDGQQIEMARAPYESVVTSFPNAGSSPSLAANSSGDLFVAPSNTSFQIDEYVPPYTGTPIAITTGIYHPSALQLDSLGNLFVANNGSSSSSSSPSPSPSPSPSEGNTITEYSAPYTGVPTNISQGIDGPIALALGASNTLYVENAVGTELTTYPVPYSTPSLTLSLDHPQHQIALDYLNNLYVLLTDAVVVYAPPYTGKPIVVTRGITGPVSMAVDDVADLFVANCPKSPCTVLEFQPPYNGDPTIIYSTSSTVPLSLGISP